MDFGIPHRILCEDDTTPNHVYAGGCKLIGIFCSSVGLTGLPTDPPPPTIPTLTKAAPTFGADGVQTVILTGNNLNDGSHGSSKVFIGDVEQTDVLLQNNTSITFTAKQGAAPLDTPQPIRVEWEDGAVATAPETFTFRAVPLPVIAGISPVSGPDNTPITITGSGFGNEIGQCKIGGEFVVVETWTDTLITALASQGDKPSDVALPLTVARSGGEPVELAAAFTFTAAAVVADPVVASVTPSEGPNGTEVTIAGTGFGAVQGNGMIGFGYDTASIASWSDTSIVCNAVQSMSASNVPQPVVLVRDDGRQSDGSVAFMFTDVVADAARSKGRKMSAKKKRKSVTSVEVEGHSAEVTMPEFASGGGVMIRNAEGTKILVGPFELLAKTLYELPLDCPDGIEIVASGKFDITLLLAPR